MPSSRPVVSVVVPAFQEEESLRWTIPWFIESLSSQRRPFELIVVNDGSRDRSGEVLDELAAREPRLRVIHLARNFGQTAAMMAGFWAARGDIVVPLDADGQNDPGDVEMLVDKLENGGFDLVSGWRKDRKDPWLRSFVSRVANAIISRVTGVKLHDYGCTLKAYRAHQIRDARLFGEMHRFIPVYAAMHGARICEVVTRHHPRKAGRSKYGYGRIIRVTLDLILVRMLQKYRTKPLHFFGKFTQWSCVAGLGCFGFAAAQALWSSDPWKAFWGKAPLVGLLFFMLGFFAVMLGLVAELAMRASYEYNAGRYWDERRRVNFGPGEPPSGVVAARTMEVDEVAG